MNPSIIDTNLQIIFYIIIIVISITVITKVISKFMKKRESNGKDMTASYLIKDIITYSLYFVALMYILQFFGVNLAGTLLSLGIVGIAVSLRPKILFPIYFQESY